MIGRHWGLGVLCVATLFVASCAAAGSRADRHAGVVEGWSSAPPLRHARAAHAVVSTGDAIYAMAGTGGVDGSPVMEVERFDGAEWRDETRLQGEGLNAPAAAALGGKVYLIGGFGTVTNVPTSVVHVYDTTLKKWGRAADLPAPRGGHAAVVMDGLIHVLGGGNSRSTIADHSVFDPATNRWVERAPLPQAEGSPVAVVAGGRLYVIGGRGGPRDFGDVFVYDGAADAWSAGPAVDPRATCGAVEHHGTIYLFGGESQARASVLADVLSLRTGAISWQREQPMPTARGFARAVLFRGAAYVVGGSLEPQASHAPLGTSVVERLILGTTSGGRSLQPGEPTGAWQSASADSRRVPPRRR